MSSDSSLVRKRSRGESPRKRRKGFLRGLKPGVKERLSFLGGFLRGPARVGALAPSSPALAEEMIRGFTLGTSETVVELGPGTGAFTGPILRAVGEKTTFFAIELDRIFAAQLRGRFPALLVYNDSAERLPEYLSLHGKRKADHIISGLPWASLPREVQDRIFEAVLASLDPGGVFVTFQYLHARWLPNALRLRKRLRKHFARVELGEIVWKNFPPAFVYRCTR